jgi:hypothetical protein
MTNTTTARWSWKSEPVLMERLRQAQNSDRLESRDVMSIVGFFTSPEQLEQHVLRCEADASR